MVNTKYEFERAIKIVGSQSEMARRLNCKPGHVWFWLNRAKTIPAEIVISVEKMTHGIVTRHDLRPDIYPDDAT